MKKIIIATLVMSGLLYANGIKERNFDEYLKSFDLKERKTMKSKSKDMLEMVKNGEAVLIDIRFAEEFKAWSLPFSKNIPLNELPSRLHELPKDKLIITACPHNSRSNLARIYLTMKGYNAKYLVDGLITTMDDYLRGDKAVNYLRELEKSKK